MPRPLITAPLLIACAALGFYWFRAGSPSVPTPLYTPKTSQPWTPPIGIPEPEFGIKEVAPIKAERTYYVAAESEKATDHNNEFGSLDKPRRTIPLTLPAGSVVEIHGTYDFNHDSPNFIHALGTVSAPVYIRGRNTDSDRAVVTHSLVVYGSYVIVENIFFDHTIVTSHGESVAIGLPGSDNSNQADCRSQQRPACSDHVVFRHNEARGFTGPGAFKACGGISVGGWLDNLPPGSSQNQIVFWDNYIHDEGQMTPLRDDDQSCSVLNVGRYASHVWIVDNHCFNVAQSCVQIVPTNDGSAYNDTHHIYIGRNESNRASKNAFWVKAASDVIISQNVAHDTIEKSYNPSTGFGLQYGPQRVWFLFNETYNVSGGIWMASDSSGGPDQRYFVIGNFIHDIGNQGLYFRQWNPRDTWSAAAIFDATGKEVFITDNLIWGLNQANGINQPAGGGQEIIANNIIAGLRQHFSWAIHMEDEDEFKRSTIDYNIVSPFRLKGGNEEFTSPSEMRSARKCLHCSEVTPTFKDSIKADFNPAPGSPSIGKGIQSPVYEVFEKLYGIDIRKDFSGRPRVPQGAWDIGPFMAAPQDKPGDQSAKK